MCRSIERDREITRCANGRCLRVTNPSRREIGIVQVDGCLINDQSKRVDWLVELPEKKKLKDGLESIKLVELKGSDVPYAYKQMEATMLHPNLSSCVHLIDEGFIVSKQSPSMQASIQVARMAFQTKFKIPVHVVNEAVIDAG